MSKKSTADYWRKREEAWAKEYRQNEERWQRQIWTIYKNLKEDMQAEIDAWYQRYAKAEGITMAEAKRRVSRSDQDYYARRAKQLVDMAQKDMANGTSANAQLYFSANANSDMRIYNTTMKVDRMQLLQAMLDIQIDIAAGKIDETMAQALTEQAEKTYLNQAKILGETVIQNMERIPELVNASFHGATFSERIWGAHQQKLKDDMQRILSRGLVLGERPDRFRKMIESQTDLKAESARKATARLLNTEFARVQTTAQLNSIQTAGFEQFMFITSAGCCHKCRGNNGKTFDIKGSMSGDNLPPMHPNCHCSIAAYSDREEYEKWLDEFAENGTEWEEWRSHKGEFIEEEEKTLSKTRPFAVNWEVVNGPDYRKKFVDLIGDEDLGNRIHQKAIDILKHRQGTDFEDIHLISLETKSVVGSQTKTETIPVKEEADRHQHVIYNDEMKRAIKKSDRGKLISIHNHPESYPPSGSDFASAFRNGYGYGVVVGHNGEIYGYKVGKKFFSAVEFDMKVERNRMICGKIDLAYQMTLDEFARSHGIEWVKI